MQPGRKNYQPSIGVDLTPATRLLTDAMGYRFSDTEGAYNFAAEVMRLGRCLECPNCGANVSRVTLVYCGDYCRDFCKIVRSSRKALSDQEMDHETHQRALEGIAIKLPHLYGGGYPATKRQVSGNIRQEVFARDKYTCMRCGNPATEIDHIQGNSNDLANLQALCGPCNLNKRWLITVNRKDNPDEWKRIDAIRQALVDRIGAITPRRACDDEGQWESSLQIIRKLRSLVVLTH